MCDDSYFKYKATSVPIIEHDDLIKLVELFDKWDFNFAFPSVFDQEWVCVKHVNVGVARVVWSWNVRQWHLKVYIGKDPIEAQYTTHRPGDEINLLMNDGWPDGVETFEDMVEFSKQLVSQRMFKED